MSIAELLEQARALSVNERKELAKSLIDLFDAGESAPTAKTGAEIVAMLQEMEPVSFVDDSIHDPAEWVQMQRQKRARWLNTDGDEPRLRRCSTQL